MKLVDFKNMYYSDYNLYHPFAMNQSWENNKEFLMSENRKTSALFYLKDCRAEYTLESGGILSAPKGSIIYIPQGSKYKTRFFCCTKDTAEAQLIEFELRDKNNEPFTACEDVTVIGNDRNHFYSDMFDEAIDIFSKPVLSYSAFKASVYNLITEIAGQYRKENIYSKKFYSIAPAINYLEKTPVPDITVAALAEMCHVSEECFRGLFKQYSGMTPSKYCLNIKITKAKKLLQSNMYTIREIANMLGYDDPGYFTKVFKKSTGILPVDYNKRL